MGKVLGVFDNDDAVSALVSALAEADIDSDAVEVVDIGRLLGEVEDEPLGAVYVGTQMASAAHEETLEPEQEAEAEVTASDIRRYIEALGAPIEHLDFYTNRIAEGGTVVIVDAGDRDDEVEELMEAHDAQTANET